MTKLVVCIHCKANAWKGMRSMVSLAAPMGSTTDTTDKFSTAALSSLVGPEAVSIVHLISSKDLFLSLQ